MCVYVRIFICIYIYMCVYVYICMYICIYVYVCIYMCVCVCVCVCSIICSFIHFLHTSPLVSYSIVFIAVFNLVLTSSGLTQ